LRRIPERIRAGDRSNWPGTGSDYRSNGVPAEIPVAPRLAVDANQGTDSDARGCAHSDATCIATRHASRRSGMREIATAGRSADYHANRTRAASADWL